MYQNYQPYPNQFGYQQNPYATQQAQYTSQYNTQYSQQQPQQYQQQDMLSGKIVDSIEVVRAINADLSGKANYYPKSDGTEIYCKRINPQTGASGIQTYVLRNETDSAIPTQEQQITAILSDFRQEMSGQIAELKDLVVKNTSKPAPVQQNSIGGGK